MNKPYKLTDKEKADVLGKLSYRFPSLEDTIAHAAQKKLLEYQKSQGLLKHEYGLLASFCLECCEACQLLEEFGIGNEQKGKWDGR